MAALRCALLLLCLLIAVTSEPVPGRVPKVYNALITSNQNLEPSKAYPVYQPVFHDTTFTFPFQPVFYGGGFPFSTGLLPALSPKDHSPNQPQANPSSEAPPEDTSSPSSEAPASNSEQSTPDTSSNDNAPSQAPLPPATESPIPLNHFGLPTQVLPLSRLDPAYSGFTQVGPFPYGFPGLRFYDPYDPFSFNPYLSPPLLYGPLTNLLGQGAPIAAGKEALVAAAPTTAPTNAETPPPEPANLNELNYSADPSIPNVPPPPLPQGGLKSEEKA